MVVINIDKFDLINILENVFFFEKACDVSKNLITYQEIKRISVHANEPITLNIFSYDNAKRKKKKKGKKRKKGQKQSTLRNFCLRLTVQKHNFN